MSKEVIYWTIYSGAVCLMLIGLGALVKAVF